MAIYKCLAPVRRQIAMNSDLKPAITLVLIIAAMPAAVWSKPEYLRAPERGFVSSQPAETWEQGLISGNGTTRPEGETLIVTDADHVLIFVDMEMINDEGIIKEWLTPRLDNRDSHRHSSQLYPLFDGMPAVIIKMLVASGPGRIQLLPALPTAWPTGTIEGVLCRGQIEIKRLHWDKGSIVVNLISAKKQTIILEAPADIMKIDVQKGKVAVRTTGRKNSRRLSIAPQQEIVLNIMLK